MVILRPGGNNPYTAQGTFPRRGGHRLSGTCIVHTSEGFWTNGVNSLTGLIQTRKDYGAYHRAVDWEDIAIYFDWEWECWQDSETNPWAVGISCALQTISWGNMPAHIEEGFYRNLAACAADFVKYMDSAKGITVPLVRITGAQARAGVPGFCAHGDSGKGRSDPGSKFDWDRFFRYTAEILDGVAPEVPIVIEPKEWDELATKAEIEDVVKAAVSPEALKAAFEKYGAEAWLTNSYGDPVQVWSILRAIDKHVNDNHAAVNAKLNAISAELAATQAVLKAVSAPDIDVEALVDAARKGATQAIEAGIQIEIEATSKSVVAKHE